MKYITIYEDSGRIVRVMSGTEEEIAANIGDFAALNRIDGEFYAATTYIAGGRTDPVPGPTGRVGGMGLDLSGMD
ncbi:MAG TPA: hypothetical protein VGC40_10215 [Paenirhodobacter sp.]